MLWYHKQQQLLLNKMRSLLQWNKSPLQRESPVITPFNFNLVTQSQKLNKTSDPQFLLLETDQKANMKH